MKVEVVPHNPAWRTQFEQVAEQLQQAMGVVVLVVHHIGSTAIPGIYAKPVIDLLVEVTNIWSVDDRAAALETLGYEAMGEFGIVGRRYFRRQIGEIRTHNVHIFAAESPHIARHLAFRDYLMAHPDEAQQYSDLKRSLARQYPHDIQGYMDGKDAFIRAIDQKAALWRANQ